MTSGSARSDRRGHLFHDRTCSGFSNRKRRHHHNDVDRVILLAVNINWSPLAFLGDLSATGLCARVMLDGAAAEAAIGLAILVVYFRNRGRSRVKTPFDEKAGRAHVSGDSFPNALGRDPGEP